MLRFALPIAVFAAAVSLGPTAVASATSSPSAILREAHLKYPAPAAKFRDYVEGRIAKARAQMEQSIVDGKLDRTAADALRARFEAAVAQVRAKVDEVCADGTVTKDEAKAVRDLARSLRHDDE